MTWIPVEEIANWIESNDLGEPQLLPGIRQAKHLLLERGINGPFKVVLSSKNADRLRGEFGSGELYQSGDLVPEFVSGMIRDGQKIVGIIEGDVLVVEVGDAVRL